MPTKKSVRKPAKKGRPVKVRVIRKEPGTRQFSPRGKVGRPGYKEIHFDEFEAIRMIDYMSLNQAEASKHMGISQQTFSRVLRAGRKRLTEALINGEIIKVQGGVFKVEKASKDHQDSDSGMSAKSNIDLRENAIINCFPVI